VPDACQQSTNFAISPFLQFQFKDRAAALSLDYSHTPESEEPFGKIQTFAKLRKYFRSRPAGHMTPISSDNFKTRMSKSLCQITVVCDQQQAGRVFVQSSDCEQTLI
jgi:carboxypeptidase C (cathepsin A)